MHCTLYGVIITTGIKKIRDRNVFIRQTSNKVFFFLPFCLRILFRLSEIFVYFTNSVYRLGKTVILNRTSLFHRHEEGSHPYLVFEFQLFDRK